MPAEKKHGQEGQQPEGEQKRRAIPEFKSMPAHPADPPESGIGMRIGYARRQLGLSIEALARYTVNFDLRDKKGIPPTSLLRYESGKYEPGAREIRILCDAFLASPRWLIYGQLDNAGEDATEQALIQALEAYVVGRATELRMEGDVPLRKMLGDKPSVAQRFDWLAQAKKPAQNR